MNLSHFSVQSYADPQAVSRAAGEAIILLANELTKSTAHFSIALSGGSTPKAVYTLLASPPLVRQMPWDKTHIYFGDERHVRPDHPDSNYRMAYEAMLKSIPIPPENIFPIPTHDEIALCAEKYELLLHINFPGSTFPRFDLVMLGIGPDGHMASLFPDTPAPEERHRWVTWCDPVAANPGIKPPVKRVTMTAPVIWNAAHVFVLATGAEKAPVLANIFSDEDPPNPPVSRLLRKCHGKVKFFLDQASASTGLR